MAVSVILPACSRARPETTPARIDPWGKLFVNLKHDLTDVIPGFHPSVCICGTQEREDFVMIGRQRPADRIGQTSL